MHPEDKHVQERVKKLRTELQEIVENARKKLDSEDYRGSAKLYRQAASVLRKIDSILDTEQNFSDRNSLNDLSGRRWLKSTKSWIIADGKPSDIPKEIKNHPGSYPPSLASHFIEFFTKKEDWVLDPFVGIGSTAQACKELGRNCIGIELNPEYAQYAQDRVKSKEDNNQKIRIFNDDSRRISGIWDENNLPDARFLITSPPYWNILAKSRGGVESTHRKRIKAGLDEKYSENSADIGNLSTYEEYLNELTQIFKDIQSVMLVGAYLCVIVQNFRPKDGIMRPLAWDIGHNLGKIFTLKQEFIWCQNQKNLGIWGYPTTYVSNVHHHYCLIFQN